MASSRSRPTRGTRLASGRSCTAGQDWCEERSRELLRELEDEGRSSEKVAAEVYEATAVAAAAAAAVEEFMAELARSESKLLGAKEVRAEEPFGKAFEPFRWRC